MCRIETSLFENGHYLGRPAEYSDDIIKRRARIIRSIPGFCDEDLDLIDAGCGTGGTMLELAPYFRICTGVDIYEQHGVVLEKEAGHRALDNVRFIRCDLENDSLSRQWKRLTCFEVVEHLHDEGNLIRISNLLEKDGLAVFTVPNKSWVFETHGARLPLLPWNRVPFFSWLPGPVHGKFANARIYTLLRFRRLLRRCGLQPLLSRYVTAPLDVLPDGAFRNFLKHHIFRHDTTSFPILAVSLLVLARRVGE